MVAKPPHNRKLGLGGISLTTQRVSRHTGQALNEIGDEIEQLIVDSGYLEEAPFSWVTIMIRYGLSYDQIPTYQKINKKFGDLPLSIEVDTHDLIDSSLDDAKLIFGEAILRALIHAGEKYERPTDRLEEALESLLETR